MSDTVFAGTGAGPSFSEDYMPVVFSTLADGTGCCYIGMRAAPKVAWRAGRVRRAAAAPGGNP
ncbi:hypothetical protein [Rhizohabitans arisaemae]|uniref:hypothetical protein n=1 Tax=Rhizohabitans arisaemae TaxID=2720610 RepID=UPI0024B1800D|nr:hypothetical protein [Rhizohabitans arisaemae]